MKENTQDSCAESKSQGKTPQRPPTLSHHVLSKAFAAPWSAGNFHAMMLLALYPVPHVASPEGMKQAEASALFQSPLSVWSSEHASKQLWGLWDVLPTMPAWASEASPKPTSPWRAVGTSCQLPSLSHSLVNRKISSLETLIMRKRQGTHANVCISFPGMTTPFPRSSQTHGQPGSKQGPVSPSSHSLPGFGRDMQAAPLEINKLPYGFLVSSGDTWICFCNEGKNFAVQR